MLRSTPLSRQPDEGQSFSFGEDIAMTREQQDAPPRRNHSAILKAKVALTALGGDQTLAQVAERFDTHPNQTNDWKKKLLEKAAASVNGSADRPVHRQRISG